MFGPLVVAALFAAGALTAGVGDVRAQAGEHEQRPNLILVLVDDLDVTSMRILLEGGHLPNITKHLVEGGVVFDSAVVTTPLCCPSRATLLTGQYAHNHGVRDNVPPMGSITAFADEDTLAVQLQGLGYRTGHFGKYVNGYGELVPLSYVPPGWDRWETLGVPVRYYGYTLSVDGQAAPLEATQSVYATDRLATDAAAFIAASAGLQEPFFAMVTPFAAHLEGGVDRCWMLYRYWGAAVPAARHAGAFADATLPWGPATDERDVSDKPAWVQSFRGRLSTGDRECADHHRRAGLESMLAVDDLVGTLAATLEGTGLSDSTAWIFLSDNGYLWGEHGLVSKHVAYEDSLRVPFMARVPGGVVGVSSCLVTNNDVAPTLWSLAGGAARDEHDGRDLTPVLANQDESSCRKGTFIANYPDRPTPGFQGVRSLEHKYVEHSTGAREFYDLSQDPHELENLIGQGSAAGVVASYADWLRALEGCQGSTCRSAEDADPSSLSDASGGTSPAPPSAAAPPGASVFIASIALASALMLRRRGGMS
jgi:arylsulfatase A-like enzyme